MDKQIDDHFELFQTHFCWHIKVKFKTSHQIPLQILRHNLLIQPSYIKIRFQTQIRGQNSPPRTPSFQTLPSTVILKPTPQFLTITCCQIPSTCSYSTPTSSTQTVPCSPSPGLTPSNLNSVIDSFTPPNDPSTTKVLAALSK